MKIFALGSAESDGESSGDELLVILDDPRTFSAHSAIYGHQDWTFPGSVYVHSCSLVLFEPPFENLQTSEIVHVQAGVGYRDHAPSQAVLFAWIERVTSRGFYACAGYSGFSAGPLSLSVEWLAYVAKRRSFLDINSSRLMHEAVVNFSDFTTQKLCHREQLVQSVGIFN